MSPVTDANPLLDIPFRIPFDRIRAEHVAPAVEHLLEAARTRLERLAGADEARTFENTMRALDGMTEPLDRAVGVVRHLESVATYPELRAAYNAIQPTVSAFYSSIPLHEGLWNAVKEYAGSSEAASLQGARARYVKKTVDDFRRHGADLDAAGKTRLKEIDVELAELTTRFAQNVLDSTNAFELVITDAAGLAGLPPTAVDEARQSAASKGLAGWRFTLKEPSYLAVMTYLDDRGVREQVYRAHTTRATAGALDNRPLVARILELRRAKARLLGFRDFADLVLEDRMAHSGARALAFLEDLRRKTESHFARENRELEDFRRQLEGPQAGPLEPWDIAYYAEKMRKALYDIDQEMLRPYFPLERVIEGLFEVTRRLYGIRVSSETGVPAWDPQARYYNMFGEDGQFLGAFFADWFPRENKRGGAWMDALITGVPRPHLGLICGNLTPPAGGKPALLTHREVETIFHEFGHLLHHLLSDVEIRSLAGTNVAWDFVELPSQIMENWCWEREALDLFARHYQTGDPIPGELLERMWRARTFRSANGQMRQLGFGFLDLKLHVEYEPERDGDAIEYGRRILQSFTPAPLPPDYAMPASFSHLFASPVGYGAGYYSYKWAEVLDADAFTRFRAAGVFNPEAGRAFRNSILSKGDSEDPAELYRSFMGRDPDPSALLRRLGLGVPASGDTAG
ncbi:MAG: M3 family metallopeptidase [Bryobacterales bacterium]|nr:M3 family metallopeptidase [Bryobacterales bacterium]